jgi:hypothetical protein
MNAVNTLFFAVGLATALACLLVLRRSFQGLFVELCGSEPEGALAKPPRVVVRLRDRPRTDPIRVHLARDPGRPA